MEIKPSSAYAENPNPTDNDQPMALAGKKVSSNTEEDTLDTAK